MKLINYEVFCIINLGIILFMSIDYLDDSGGCNILLKNLKKYIILLDYRICHLRSWSPFL
jgi:hypothetical protein